MGKSFLTVSIQKCPGFIFSFWGVYPGSISEAKPPRKHSSMPLWEMVGLRVI